MPSRGAGRGRGRGRGRGSVVGEASSSSRAGGPVSTAPAAIGLGSRGGSRGRDPKAQCGDELGPGPGLNVHWPIGCLLALHVGCELPRI